MTDHDQPQTPALPSLDDMVLTAYTVTLAYLQDDDEGAVELLGHLNRDELHITCAGMAGYLRGFLREATTPETYADCVATLRREAAAHAEGMRG